MWIQSTVYTETLSAYYRGTGLQGCSIYQPYLLQPTSCPNMPFGSPHFPDEETEAKSPTHLPKSTQRVGGRIRPRKSGSRAFAPKDDTSLAP